MDESLLQQIAWIDVQSSRLIAGCINWTYFGYQSQVYNQLEDIFFCVCVLQDIVFSNPNQVPFVLFLRIDFGTKKTILSRS